MFGGLTIGNYNQALGVLVLKWPKENCLQDTEDCGVGGNPQCERKDRYKSESRILPQHAQGIT